jgi:hypothetical protein
MRSTFKSALFAGVAGAFVFGAIPAAFAGFDEAGQDSFWTNQTVNAPTQEARGSTRRDTEYRATYASPAAQAATPVQKDPAYFYHAMGTMGEQ